MEYHIEFLKDSSLEIGLDNTEIVNLEYKFIPLSYDNFKDTKSIFVSLEVRFINNDINNQNIIKLNYFKKWLFEKKSYKDIKILFSGNEIVLNNIYLDNFYQEFNEKNPGNYKINFKNDFFRIGEKNAN